jgi:hypothetical protein
MVKWNLLKKLKLENEDNLIKEKKITNKENFKRDNKPIVEYKETIYASIKSSKKTSKSTSSNGELYCSDVGSIKKKINKPHIIHVKKQRNEVDKTIDKIIQNKKK